MTNRLIALTAWGVIVCIILATLVPLGMRPHLSPDANVERLGAFTAAGLLLGLAYPRHFLWVVIFTIALACTLEMLQQFAVQRHGQTHNIIIKVTGGMAGLFVAGLILRAKQALKK